MSESQYKFAEFQLDCASFELRRQGRSHKSERISLERIPMELLILLLERQGSVVTRQEIVDRLWGKDVFVDTEHGINTAIRKIRQALKDDPESPRFVHTVSGKGYRFVAEKNGDPPHATAVAAMPPEAPQPMFGQPPTLPALSPVEGTGGAEISRRSRDASDVATVEITPSQTKPAIAAVALSLITAAALTLVLPGRIFRTNQAAQIHSLAVIPLANLSGEPAQDYFADGMTDELITALAKNRTLRVVSRTSAMQYKGVNRPVRDIARELGVDGILEGSVSRNANRVHMTVQLIYALTDTHVWAESYDRDISQASSLPEELSQTIAKEVRVATSPAPPQRYINPEAHDAYLHGRYFWLTHNVPQTLPYFQKAIQLQPDYAAAWSGLADTYGLAGMTGDLQPRDAMAKSEAAARKALELDHSLPEVHTSMCVWYTYYGWDLARAEAECRRGLELNPNYPELHHIYASLLLSQNRSVEALVEEKRYRELDPLGRSWDLGEFYLDMRQYDAAIAELTLQSNSHRYEDRVFFYLSQAYWLKGMYKESEQTLEKFLQAEHRTDDAAAAHKAWEQGGEKLLAQWKVNNLKAQARHHYIPNYEIACTIAGTGEKGETLEYLEAAYRDHSPNLIDLQGEPMFDFLHSDPRYQSLVKKIGLPPAY